MKRTHTVGPVDVLRVFLTAIILYGFAQAFLALQLLNSHNRNAESYAATKHLNALAGDRASLSTPSPRKIRTPWPKYPGAIRDISKPGSFNGDRLVTEEMRVRAGPGEAVSYFRRAMQSKGWEDYTEEYFGIRPDVLDCSGSYRNLQDKQFIQRYDSVMETHACFRRRGESVMIRASDQKSKDGRTRISLSHLGTDSLLNVARNISERMSRAQRSSRPISIMRTEKQWGNDRYSSEILSSALSMKRFAAHMNRQLRGRGWTEVKIDTEMAGVAAQPSGAPHITTFERGGRMAMMTVTPGPEGKGSSGMLTEIAGGQ